MRKILIVEDDPSVAKVLKERLLGSGFSVLCAGDSYQGFMLAKKESPQLIILDLMLPAGGGEGMLKNLKNSSQTSMIPILVLTASRDPVLKQKMLSEGVDGYMEKPYDPAELLATINAILQRRG